MKILYITTAYILKNSSAAIRNNALVKGLIELGYEVDVITVKWPEELHSDYLSHESIGNTFFYNLPNLQKISKLKSTNLKKSTHSSFITTLKNFVKKIIFFPDECFEFSKVVDYSTLLGYDNIITSSDHKASHYVGLKIKHLKSNVNWIQIWGDPWSSDVNTLSFLKKYYSIHEKELLYSADAVIYISTATREYMAQRYPLIKDKIHYIPRGFFNRVDASNIVNKPIKIVYTGILSFGRNISNLLQAISRCPNHDIEVHVYGDGSNIANNLSCKYSFLKVFPSVSQKELVNVYSDASILLYISNIKGSSQIPGKLYDYMGTNRPIFCLVEEYDDAISKFLGKHDRCFLCRNTQFDIINNFEQIIQLANKTYNVNEEYSPISIAKQFSKLFI